MPRSANAQAKSMTRASASQLGDTQFQYRSTVSLSPDSTDSTASTASLEMRTTPSLRHLRTVDEPVIDPIKRNLPRKPVAANYRVLPRDLDEPSTATESDNSYKSVLGSSEAVSEHRVDNDLLNPVSPLSNYQSRSNISVVPSGTLSSSIESLRDTTRAVQTVPTIRDVRSSKTPSLRNGPKVMPSVLRTNPHFTAPSFDGSVRESEIGRGSISHSATDSSQMSRFSATSLAKEAETPRSRLKYWTEKCPAWMKSRDNSKPPIDIETIVRIFNELEHVFQFQHDSARNMLEHFMTLLDSRASRMTHMQALESLHADYIGGPNSNYRKWYMAAQMDVCDRLGFTKSTKLDSSDQTLEDGVKLDFSLKEASRIYKYTMENLSITDRVTDVALYLLCWGEANQVRFMPEALDFIYKCASYYYYGLKSKTRHPTIAIGADCKSTDYLSLVITPLYTVLRDQMLEKVKGGYHRKEKDHGSIIGYDDVNQLFWYREGLERIVLRDGTQLVSHQTENWYPCLAQVDWDKVFYKTYRETRSWLHVAVDFNRIWIIHISMFWFYTVFNSPSLYTVNYDYTKDNDPPAHVRWTLVSLGGAVGPLVNIIGTLSEFIFVPRRWPGSQNLVLRLFVLFIALGIIVAPTVYIFTQLSFEDNDTAGISIAVVQMSVAVLFTLFFSIAPLGSLFSWPSKTLGRARLANYYFTASFHKLKGNDSIISYGLWLSILIAKLTESYFFLTLSLRDPIRELSVLTLPNCLGDVIFGDFFCRQQATIVLVGMLMTDLILFFLDSYLWFIIFNTVFSVSRCFYLGVSIWTPWRNIYSRLPERIYSKIMHTEKVESGKSTKNKLVAEIWNCIINSMLKEHLIPEEQANKLLFALQGVPSSDSASHRGEHTIASDLDASEPSFFVSREDQAFHSSMFETQSEAERRISFFAQSLSTPIPDPCSVERMPAFTVLVPHYGEKILLSIRDVIRGDDNNSRISILDYLKQLHPLEWKCFAESRMPSKARSSLDNSYDIGSEVPYYTVGFKDAGPEYTNGTRVWASLRSQTLYRTISGFYNYSTAISLLFMVENKQLWRNTVTEQVGAKKAPHKRPLVQIDPEREKTKMANRKFRLLVSMQRFCDFTPHELEDTEKLLKDFPSLNIAFLIRETSTCEDMEDTYYSALIDSTCPKKDGIRVPRYKILFSGNPILGDGKGDNQNHALIFYRGEYIQLVDANQDNYLEECLKIRSVLAEFEEMTPPRHPYGGESGTDETASVAILGAREYIFSENIGVLGDIAAGKEQTFGTLFARTLAKIGGKLHYGHPDFLNGIFMTTRGGVSKAQRGLHLNEDIYAGMNAVLRGGIIKHSEYIQCGKGRDLGFGSILNFTSKIGAGMGEQMLSREYFYLGTRLPFDRFLSFYYAHPGFHINNMFIVVSLEMFLVVLLNLSALAGEAVICLYDPNSPKTDLHHPPGCQNLTPLFMWVQRCVLSISLVFMISFLPLFVQELTERGFWRSTTRLVKHLLSLSPVFEVFVCQIYAHSLTYDLSLGGARYIPTGRGFAISRAPFSDLYTRFAGPSIYFGFRSVLILLFVSITSWKISFMWFWVTTVALCMAPIIYNPHQFSPKEFIIDYRHFILWMFHDIPKYENRSRDKKKERRRIEDFNPTEHEATKDSDENLTTDKAIDSERKNYRDSQKRMNPKKTQNKTWISFTRGNRALITGYKRKLLSEEKADTIEDKPSPHFFNLIVTEILFPGAFAATVVVPYIYINSQNDLRAFEPYANPLLRLGLCTFGPIAVNFVVVMVSFLVSCCTAPVRRCYCGKVAVVLLTVTRLIGFFVHAVFFELLWMMEKWSFRRALLGQIAAIMIQNLVFKVITSLILTRELKQGRSSTAWWTGRWASSELGWLLLTQPVRELICKVMEMSLFAMDFTIGHFMFFVQIPLLFVPYIDLWHTVMLFWLKPSRKNVLGMLTPSSSEGSKRRRRVRNFSVIFCLALILYIGLLILPVVLPVSLKLQILEHVAGLHPTLVRTTLE